MDTTRPSLLIRIKEPRNLAAWEEFDALYRPLLYRFAQLRGLGHADAEDIVQHCMGRVHEHIRTFEYDARKGRFKSWLRTMVNNRWRNMIRDRHEQLAQSQDFRQAQQREETPEETFDRVWAQEHLKAAMRWLRHEVDGKTFQAFQRYVIEDQPVKEVCDTLDLSANQLYKIKWRLTQQLRDKMADLEGED
jgi:RNA polymerase sigma-70 factor (ECF subfamily)